ncbi:xaa-Pro aminopeptidase 1-like isoform X2 [Bacillus rossius redtenbacheri]|uniref:xaa-Pro aminopeptidase 1-like isoform X2 n=1 Tax=Bacillus rossius redtenbacheri TaxID=93214 RepID=UPI002FDE0E97
MASAKVLAVCLAVAAGLSGVVCPSGRLGCPAAPGTLQPASRVDTGRQLYLLRSEIARSRTTRVPPLDAFIVTRHDEHQSEDVAERDKRIRFLTGFSGSYGLAVVTQERAALWTDGRYFLQAEEELDCRWELMRAGQPGVPSATRWLAGALPPGARVGADPRLVPHATWGDWALDLARANISLVAVGSNPVDQTWTDGRPLYAPQPAFVHHLKYAGKAWEQKVADLRAALGQLGAEAMVVTALDEVAWLLNVRGRDLPFTPVVRAYLVVGPLSLHLFTNRSKLPQEVRDHLRSQHCHNENCVRLHHYENITTELSTLSQGWASVLIPAQDSTLEGASQAVLAAVRPERRLLLASPVLLMKAVKNPVERAGMRSAHVRDAAALCDFLALLEHEVSRGKRWTELDVARNVDKSRLQQELSRGLSFATIAGFGPNGALPHYRPSASTSQAVDRSSTLVLDSGGQYFDGTTDVTRTLHYGAPTAFQREIYTRVLKGSVQMTRAVFPALLPSASVDVLARGPLWRVGLDFRHGTGHGVGHFLSVHEHPIEVMYSNLYEPFQEGYFFSNEPGYYEEGNFGVRLENILEVVNQSTPFSFDGPYLGFKTVTLVPYEPKLIDVSMLSNDEIRWLNTYNRRIMDEVGAELKRQRRMGAFSWLLKKTTYIPEHAVRAGCAGRCPSPAAVAALLSVCCWWLLSNDKSRLL